MSKDISNRQVKMLEMYELVDSVCQQVNEALDQQQSYNAQLIANINEALNAIMEAKQVELVAGPASVKRIKRDASGQIEYLEEYGQLPQAADPGIPSEVAAQVNLLAALDVASRR